MYLLLSLKMNFRPTSLILFFLSLSSPSFGIPRESITFDLANVLKKVITYVFIRGSPDYELARPVHNGGCRHIFPLLIVKPLSTQEVSEAVKIGNVKLLSI